MIIWSAASGTGSPVIDPVANVLYVQMHAGQHWGTPDGTAISGDGDTTDLNDYEPDTDLRFELRLYAPATGSNITINSVTISDNCQLMFDAAESEVITADEVDYRSIHVSMNTDGITNPSLGSVVIGYNGTETWSHNFNSIRDNAVGVFDPKDSGDNPNCSVFYEFDRIASSGTARYTESSGTLASVKNLVTPGTGDGAVANANPTMVKPRSSIGCGHLPANTISYRISIGDLTSLGYWTTTGDRSFVACFRTGSDVTTQQVVVDTGSGNRGLSLVIDTGSLYTTVEQIGGQDESTSLSIEADTTYIAVVSYDSTAQTATLTLYDRSVTPRTAVTAAHSGTAMSALSGLGISAVAYSGNTTHNGSSIAGNTAYFLGISMAYGFYAGSVPSAAVQHLAKKYNPWAYSTQPTLAQLTAALPQTSGINRLGCVFQSASDGGGGGATAFVNGVQPAGNPDESSYGNHNARAYDAAIEANFASDVADAIALGYSLIMLHVPGGRAGGPYTGHVWCSCTDGRRDFLRSDSLANLIANNPTFGFSAYVGIIVHDDLDNNTGTTIANLPTGSYRIAMDLDDPEVLDALWVNLGYLISIGFHSIWFDAGTGTASASTNNGDDDYGYDNLPARCAMTAKYLYRGWGLHVGGEAWTRDEPIDPHPGIDVPLLRLANDPIGYDPGTWWVEGFDTSDIDYTIWASTGEMTDVISQWNASSSDNALHKQYAAGVMLFASTGALEEGVALTDPPPTAGPRARWPRRRPRA